MPDFQKDSTNNNNSFQSSANHLENGEENSSVGLFPPPLRFSSSGDSPQNQAINNISSASQVVQRKEDENEQTIQAADGPGTDEHAIQNTIDAATRARTIHEAVDGLGTDEHAIYGAVIGLSREQVKLLKRTYYAVYGATLMEDLRGDLSDDELRIVLIHMGYWPVQYGTVLGTYQLEQAKEKILELPDYSLNTFSNLIDIQPTYEHRAYVAKALAAGNPILDIIPFAYEISSHDHEWMENNLRLTRQTDDRGLQQSWNDSCGPTTVQTIQGELDPIYALNVRRNNANVDQGNGTTTGTNSAIATDQQTMLEGAGGVAVERGGSGGDGMSMTALVDYVKERTGVDYEVVFAGSDQSAGVTAINGVLAQGLPVPLRVAQANNSGGHFVLITNRVGQNYNIHDVWEGESFVRTKDNFVSDTMDIAGWPSFRHYGKPK